MQKNKEFLFTCVLKVSKVIWKFIILSLLLETEGKTNETACWECDGFSRKTRFVA